jgi:hypothetical protein
MQAQFSSGRWTYDLDPCHRTTAAAAAEAAKAVEAVEEEAVEVEAAWHSSYT